MVLTVSWSIGWASRSTSGGVPTVIAGSSSSGLAVNFPTASSGRSQLARSATAGWWAVSAADLVHDVARFEAGCHGENSRPAAGVGGVQCVEHPFGDLRH